MKSIEIKPPIRIGSTTKNRKVFLAGSIEMGKADNWQQKVVDEFTHNGVTFFNPRRDDWDESWVQDINNPQFYEQVTWELDMLEDADIVFMYFDPTTYSPISLLELGMFSERIAHQMNKYMIVCCPEGFWRKGNVDIVCQQQGVPIFDNMETAIKALKRLLN